MKIECFPIKMKEEEALKIAAGGKNPIIRLLFGKKDKSSGDVSGKQVHHL